MPFIATAEAHAIMGDNERSHHPTVDAIPDNKLPKNEERNERLDCPEKADFLFSRSCGVIEHVFSMSDTFPFFS